MTATDRHAKQRHSIFHAAEGLWERHDWIHNAIVQGTVVFVLAIGVRLALHDYQTSEHVTRDGCEYLNLAKSLYAEHSYNASGYGLPFLARPTAPSLDLLRPPLYPILVSGAYGIFGVTHFAAQFVCIVSGALVVVVLYSLVYTLTQDRGTSFLASCFVAIQPECVLGSIRPLTEQPFTLFVLASLLALVRPPRTINTIVGAVCLGLAFLTRYQAVVFVPVVIVYFFYRCNLRSALTSSMLFVTAFLVVLAPWMWRNYSITGNPIYGDHIHIGAIYCLSENDVEARRMVLTPDTERLTVGQVWKRYPLKKLRHVVQNFRTMVLDAPLHIGHPFLFAFALIGAIVSFRRSAEMKFITLCVAACWVFFAATYFKSRFLQPIIPIYLAWSAMGVVWLAKKVDVGETAPRILRPSLVVVGIVVLVILDVGLETYKSVAFQSRQNGSEATLAYVRAATTKNDRIMALDCGRWAYHLDRYVVALPNGREEVLREFADRYQVRYFIISPSDFQWIDSRMWETGPLPSWLTLVHECPTTGTRVYECES